MPLARCPKCDGRVATVAASCPHCAFALADARRQADHGVDEIECHRCRATIPSHLPVCCNCGVVGPKAFKPFLTRRLSTIVVIALVLVGGGWARFTPFSQTSSATEDGESAILPAQIAMPTISIPVLRDVHVRWTSTWVNVREQRTVDSPVVLVLDPGVEVEVGNKLGAWWEARVDGHVVGYLSNAVLSTRPLED